VWVAASPYQRHCGTARRSRLAEPRNPDAVIPEVHDAVQVLASACSGRRDDRFSRMPGGESLTHGPAAIVDRRALYDYDQRMVAGVMVPKKSTMSSSRVDELSAQLRSGPDSVGSLVLGVTTVDLQRSRGGL